MAEKVLAKVDYIKPLEDVPYEEVVNAKEAYHRGVKEKLEAIAGAGAVTDDPTVLVQYAEDKSLERGGRPAFVVRPVDTQAVCELVRYANEIKLPVVPASSGTHNYGATLPRMGGIIVDLSGWKKIFSIDKRNRSVRIQPGVTYNELQNELEKEGLRALVPLLPRNDQSVLTAHIEGHPMLVPEFNYSEPLYTAEIVLPTGTVFRTGSAALAPPETVQSDMIGPWGPGFDWNRLYTRSQGTLGIVTWVNIMAEPLPRRQKLYFTSHSRIEDLVAFTYRLQKKWLGYECLVLNKTVLAAMLARDAQEMVSLQRTIPEYVQIFCIGGLKRFPDERIAYQEADFLEASQECHVTPQATIPEVPRAHDFFEKNLRRCWGGEVYWKDRIKGGSADIFFITTMNRAHEFVEAMQDEANRGKYNYQDIGVYLQPVENGRSAHLEFTIPFDPEDEQERTIVRNLHRAASERMYSLGGVFTRAYGGWAEMAAGRNAAQHQTAKIIKETLDPNCIMNPGKLGL